ncbi:hypothetical protein GCM10022243_26160 [Saccharothrix violaceirubra]|uniref:Uncharacterized protein n=1 Tax=Saccharothrix violaceirubra TaxID=413306 RepID=A0A7W7WXA5_9PSEU|nr:hypothetical protein [Saccharothrix violaceirubra]MBB4967190.1 hypothetical protein [Saccharothrix violaceirubra]
MSAVLFATLVGGQPAQAQPAAPAGPAPLVTCNTHLEFAGWYWGNCRGQAVIIKFRAFPTAPWTTLCVANGSDTYVSSVKEYYPEVEVLSGPCVP